MADRIGIIVDGPGDYASLKERFKDLYKIAKTDGPRGHTAQIEKIVSASRKQIEMLKVFKCSRVIILLDFESRDIPYEEFKKLINEKLSKEDFGIEVIACSPNQMIENWYLADVEEISKKRNFIKKNLKQKNYEGTHGKDELKKLIENNHSYNEVKHGSQLFNTIRLEIARNNSSSLNDFLNEIKM
ncbi:hypothetical protein FACHB389_31155 [Nostoc calcicola FACHB-389]|nr:DUF4276 family protein [Nostoc calcicola FACHB-3891]OKH22128.1 hypothetical protein FACHB389_31155 [Nostoc calcicola FACHB-389]